MDPGPFIARGRPALSADEHAFAVSVMSGEYLAVVLNRDVIGERRLEGDVSLARRSAVRVVTGAAIAELGTKLVAVTELAFTKGAAGAGAHHEAARVVAGAALTLAGPKSRVRASGLRRGPLDAGDRRGDPNRACGGSRLLNEPPAAVHAGLRFGAYEITHKFPKGPGHASKRTQSGPTSSAPILSATP
jgi:hypothetical protein